MSGSTIGKNFRITTFGESHGTALGAVVDGCPSGLPLSEAQIQVYLDRRRPGHSVYATPRKEADQVRILSGTFDGKTTGTPIALLVENGDPHSKDYDALADIFRPGHADYGYYSKYGIRDHRGGGRSSGRETVGRVAGGAIAVLVLKELGIDFLSYTRSIGPISMDDYVFEADEIYKTPLYLPNALAAEKAGEYLRQTMEQKDSVGGTIECRINGVPAGIGDPVFDKLDAALAGAIFSIGAVKGFEIGSGFSAANLRGSEQNDPFLMKEGNIAKQTNQAGGILGGMSDGSEIVFRAALKPTPSIAQPQQTVTKDGVPTTIEIHGRHDPIIVPRAVVVVETMAASVLLDLMMSNAPAKLSALKSIYNI